MDKKFTDKLVTKYPKLFKVDPKIPTPYSQRGIECGNGWYGLLDTTLSQLEFIRDNPDYVKERWFELKTLYNRIFWNNIFARLGHIFVRNVPDMYPASVSHKYKKQWQRHYKWKNLFMAHPVYIKPKNTPEIKILQIKEKFGSLRIYVKYINFSERESGQVSGIVGLAEQISCQICEDCGINKDVTRNNTGWIRSLCPHCRKIHI